MKKVCTAVALVLMYCSAIIPAFAQHVGPCQIFPSDNPWNTDISNYPIHPMSDVFIAAISKTRSFLHPDFGSNASYGIPYVVVGADQPFVPITFDTYPDESDPGPYPVPPNAPIENLGQGGDQHVLVVDTGNCMLYEMFDSRKDVSGNGWTAESGAVFNLNSNSYRPDGWTSADAAGLPIFPGLVRYDEAVIQQEIRHALRFTTPSTQRGYITPARHFASTSSDTTLPPMGLRVRLKADYDISTYTGTSKVILTALKKYGLILADNGSAWFISGATDGRWDDDDLNQLKKVPGSAFEAVNTGPIKHEPDATDIVTTEAGSSFQASIISIPIRSEAMLTCTAPRDMPASLDLIDMVGKVRTLQSDYTIEKGTHTTMLYFPRLPAGMYFVRVRTALQTIVVKFFKNE